MKNFIVENGKKYLIHPIYNKYAANDEGEIIHVKLRRLNKGHLNQTGYSYFTIYLGKNRKKIIHLIDSFSNAFTD